MTQLALLDPVAFADVDALVAGIVWQITPTGAEVARRIRWKLDCGGR